MTHPQRSRCLRGAGARCVSPPVRPGHSPPPLVATRSTPPRPSNGASGDQHTFFSMAQTPTLMGSSPPRGPSRRARDLLPLRWGDAASVGAIRIMHCGVVLTRLERHGTSPVPWAALDSSKSCDLESDSRSSQVTPCDVAATFQRSLHRVDGPSGVVARCAALATSRSTSDEHSMKFSGSARLLRTRPCGEPPIWRCPLR
jgi:hypothetical protein